MNTVEQTTSSWGADVIGKRVHPTIVQALAPFLPKPTFAAPPCPPGLQHFDYHCGDVTLTCHIAFAPAERETRDEPGEPAEVLVIAAYVRDVNLIEVLSPGRIGEIEDAFLAQKEEA